MVHTEYQVTREFPSPGSHLCGLDWDGRYLWHSDGESNLIYQITSQTGEILREIAIDRVRTDLAVDNTEIWQVGGDTKEIYVIDKTTGKIKTKIHFEYNAENACALYLDSSSYYIGYKDSGLIEQRDRVDNSIMTTLQSRPEIGGIGVIDDILWFSVFEPGKIVGIDIKTSDLVAEFSIDGKPTGLCADGTNVWYSDFSNKKIVAITSSW